MINRLLDRCANILWIFVRKKLTTIYTVSTFVKFHPEKDFSLPSFASFVPTYICQITLELCVAPFIAASKFIIGELLILYYHKALFNAAPSASWYPNPSLHEVLHIDPVIHSFPFITPMGVEVRVNISRRFF